MATAKRKQEELGDGDGDCSETIDSDSESLDMADSPRKRCRMDDDMRHWSVGDLFFFLLFSHLYFIEEKHKFSFDFKREINWNLSGKDKRLACRRIIEFI